MLFFLILICYIHTQTFFRGRKRACVTYCITYILSCITKHSPQYKILMVGRILGGIATSLLFSSFESWLVAEHNKVLKLFYYDFKGSNCLGVLLRSLPTISTHSSINYYSTILRLRSFFFNKKALFSFLRNKSAMCSSLTLCSSLIFESYLAEGL